MKQIQAILSCFLLSAGFALSGCKEEKKKTFETKNPEKTVATEDSALYGKLGEGTGMSCIEFISSGNDTLVLNKADETTAFYGTILGGAEHYGDSLSVITDIRQEYIKVLVNLSTLSRSWYSASDSIQIHLMPHGALQSKWHNRKFFKWNMHNTLLTMQDSSTMHTDTFRILSLTSDSMILHHNNSIYRFYTKKNQQLWPVRQ